MTREELHTEVATLTGEIVGMVSDLSPFDWKSKAEIDKEILALFDRYEREQWQSEPPTEHQEVLICEAIEDGQRYFSTFHDYNPGEYWPPLKRLTGRWRKVELPPEEEPKP